MSPASRAEVLNAVRTSVCACSSTTDRSRFHMIWSSISTILLRAVIVMAGLVPVIATRTRAETGGRDEPDHDGGTVSRFDLLDHDVIARANARGVTTRHYGGGAGFHDHRWSSEPRTLGHFGADE